MTKTIKLATGICLVVERDPIHTAKEVSTVDRLSSGRFIFGVGGGWNEEEMANHGTAFATRFKLMRERIEAMKQIWTQSTAAFDGELVKFEPMMQWPKPNSETSPAHHCWGCIQGGRSPTATAGFRSVADPPILSRYCPNSVKWQRTPAAIPRRLAQRADGFDPAPPAWHLIQGRFIRIDVSGLPSRICMLFRAAESTT